ncbi:class I tRNA ligase family protein [Candidatus Woesearchaeota archaeon]|nr:class I tRNA ligase family protein [Candidatus Woesearchaeota archaeon]
MDERKWQLFWEQEKIYQFDIKTKKKIYSIDTPPPTISGEIHMGHVFSYSHLDFIARFRRMQGYNVFYPFGFDNNGLPTERLVETILLRSFSCL